MGDAIGELVEIGVSQEHAAMGALAWTRLCVDTDEVGEGRLLSVVHS